MAKKIAFGSTHVVIDLPFGKTAKVHRLSDAEVLKEKFEYLAKQFNIKIRVYINRMEEPAGFGIGSILETRDALRVLQQKNTRSMGLEKKALMLAAHLLDLCLEDKPKEKKAVFASHTNSLIYAHYLLQSGLAWKKMQEIIQAQEGNAHIDSEDLKPAKHSFTVHAQTSQKIRHIHSKNATLIAKILGSPKQKGAGIYLHKKIGDSISRGDHLYTLYSENVYNLEEAKDSLKNFPIVEFSRS